MTVHQQDTNLQEAVGRELAALRHIHRLTQREVADRMNTTQMQIYTIESIPGPGLQLRTVERYADALGYDMEVSFIRRA